MHLILMVVGLTWIFGFIALIEQSSIVFQYLFCIFNSIQGLLIFVFHNIREPAVINAWRRIFSCGKYKEATSTSGQRHHDNGRSSATDKRYTDLTNVSSSRNSHSSQNMSKSNHGTENLALTTS